MSGFAYLRVTSWVIFHNHFFTVPIAHPILSTDESLELERTLLPSREQQWTAMNSAGRSVGKAILQDFGELSDMPSRLRVLVLAGKGHNGGDALLAGDEILKRHGGAEVHVLLRAEKKDLRGLTLRSLDNLLKSSRASLCNELTYRQEPFDIVIDGLLGMQFHPPLKEDLASLIREINAHRNIRFRAAVDLPSGLGDADAFQADFHLRDRNRQEPALRPRACAEGGAYPLPGHRFFPTSLRRGTLVPRRRPAGQCPANARRAASARL